MRAPFNDLDDAFTESYGPQMVGRGHRVYRAQAGHPYRRLVLSATGTTAYLSVGARGKLGRAADSAEVCFRCEIYDQF